VAIQENPHLRHGLLRSARNDVDARSPIPESMPLSRPTLEIAMTGIYLEPIGLLYGKVAREAVSLGGALPLAGGAIAFGAVRLWEGEPGAMKHAVVRTSTIQAIEEPRIKELLDRITAPRASIAGVSMDRTRIMGIVNVTPDSFSDGGDAFDPAAAIARANALADGGADFIDIGGESTRPGSETVPVVEETGRILPVLRGLAALKTPISVDTRKPEVMCAVANARADIVNDVSALTFAPDSLKTAAGLNKPVVLMHAQGDPKTMQDNPAYRDVVVEVYDFLESRIEAAVAAGLPRENLIADPGIGFGKTSAHNASLLQHISIFHGLGVPLLVGASRKRSLRTAAGAASPKDLLASASVAAALDSASQGVQIVRVHDLEATLQALAVWSWLRGGPETMQNQAS
jgi:dihydropteroate synthase